MSEQNKEIVRNAVAALSKGDYDAFLADAADDVSFTLIGETELSGTISGKQTLSDALKQLLGGGLEAPIQMTIDNLIAEGDFVAEEARGKARSKTGVDYNNTYCRVWKISGGKIQSCVEYLDTELVTKALVK